ncbi:MAG: MFS transporter [Caldilineaceae bacterium]
MESTLSDGAAPATVNNDEFVRRNLRWNFGVNLQDIIFITLGLSLISRETVMPVLVRQLTDSKIAIGLIPAVFALGFYFPQLFSANFSERLRYKKPFVAFIGGVGERTPYLLIGLCVWSLAAPSPMLTLVIFFALIGLAAGSAGFATPAWFDMIAKVIPVNRRGLWSGLGHGIGALLGVAGAYFVGRILETYAYPNNFALLFGLAFGMTVISWIGLLLTREPPSETVKERIPLGRYLGQLPQVLGRDGNYRRFLLSRTTVQLGAMAVGFFTASAIDRFTLEGVNVGLLTGVLVGSKAVMNLLWGVLADRLGHKLVLTCSAFVMALATLLAWNASSQTWLVIAFFLLGAYLAADEVSALNIILEFCQPADRPTYIGLTNTLLAPVLILAPIIGGALAEWLGYAPMFLIALAILAVGGLMMLLWVREPRQMAR